MNVLSGPEFFAAHKSKGRVAPEVLNAIESFVGGIVLSPEIMDYYFNGADSRRTSFSEFGENTDIWLLNSDGQNVLHLVAARKKVTEAEVKVGSYNRGTNMAWQYFTEKYPDSEFIEYINRLPIRKEGKGPIGFKYRQWQANEGLMHATITYAEDMRVAFDADPFFKVKE